jgi:toxin ParE1/3/4
MPPELWRVRLTAAAERDFADIVAWTAERFGDRQARRYSDGITRAIASLAGGPYQLGNHVCVDLPVGLRILTIARGAVRARHVLIYRSSADGTVEIVRILHQSMDIVRRLA